MLSAKTHNIYLNASRRRQWKPRRMNVKCNPNEPKMLSEKEKKIKTLARKKNVRKRRKKKRIRERKEKKREEEKTKDRTIIKRKQSRKIIV